MKCAKCGRAADPQLPYATSCPQCGETYPIQHVLAISVMQTREALDRVDIANKRRKNAERNLHSLMLAIELAECECSVRERNSGHRPGCWRPAVDAVIAKIDITQGVT